MTTPAAAFPTSLPYIVRIKGASEYVVVVMTGLWTIGAVAVAVAARRPVVVVLAAPLLLLAVTVLRRRLVVLPDRLVYEKVLSDWVIPYDVITEVSFWRPQVHDASVRMLIHAVGPRRALEITDWSWYTAADRRVVLEALLAHLSPEVEGFADLQDVLAGLND